MSSTDLYYRLQHLLPDQPVVTGVVSVAHADGTATVVLTGGEQVRVRNPFGSAAAASVYVQGAAIVGDAPALTPVLIEI